MATQTVRSTVCTRCIRYHVSDGDAQTVDGIETFETEDESKARMSAAKSFHEYGHCTMVVTI